MYNWVFSEENVAPTSLTILVNLARRDSGARLATVTFIDDQCQRFYARAGITIERTPLADSICRLVIESGRELVVPDITADPRTRDTMISRAMPSVTYAGYPIKNDRGRTIAVLCTIYSEIAPPDEAIRAAMRDFATVAGDLIENQRCAMLLRRTRSGIAATAEALEREVRRTRLASREADIGFWEIDLQSEKITWSDNLYAMFGLAERRALTVREVLTYLTPDSQEAAVRSVAETVSGQRFDLMLELVDPTADYLIDCRGERTHDLGGRSIMAGVMRRVPKSN